MLLCALVMAGLPGTTALFTADYPHAVNISAGRIFRDERTTPAFAITDRSSGAAVDRSSANAFADDGRYFLTRTWPTAFDTGRYLDLELGGPLPAGLTVTQASLALRMATHAGTGNVCVYLEVRRVSNASLLSTHGSSASPLACTSGSPYSALSVSLGAVSSTDIANDLRIRLFARDSAEGPLRIDLTTLIGDTPYSTFALYPVLTREQYSGGTESIPWGLAGQ